MNEPAAPETPAGLSAGALLRRARKAQGLHIAAVAAAIKVTPQKLEALENDRYDALPDATFARALAKAVCRMLKIDAEPVLALLPKNSSQGFERLGGGLNMPFRERPGRESFDPSMLRSPVIWGPILLLIGAAVLLLMPFDLRRLRDAKAPAEAASAAVPIAAEGGVFASSPIVSIPASSPEAALAASAAALGASAPAPGGDTVPAGLVVLRSDKDSWIEIVDGQGHTLISRALLAGESVALDGTPPLRVKIGNARATQLEFRGQVVDLAPATHDNVARLELK